MSALNVNVPSDPASVFGTTNRPMNEGGDGSELREESSATKEPDDDDDSRRRRCICRSHFICIFCSTCCCYRYHPPFKIPVTSDFRPVAHLDPLETAGVYLRTPAAGLLFSRYHRVSKRPSHDSHLKSAQADKTSPIVSSTCTLENEDRSFNYALLLNTAGGMFTHGIVERSPAKRLPMFIFCFIFLLFMYLYS